MIHRKSHRQRVKGLIRVTIRLGTKISGRKPHRNHRPRKATNKSVTIIAVIWSEPFLIGGAKLKDFDPFNVI